MDELVALPGVGRKTANVVLGNAFGKNEGVVVDTHVGRVSPAPRLHAPDDPVKVERDLNALVPKGRRTLGAHLLIAHGRRICVARKPRCGECPVENLCPKIGVSILVKIHARIGGNQFSGEAAEKPVDIPAEMGQKTRIRRCPTELHRSLCDPITPSPSDI